MAIKTPETGHAVDAHGGPVPDPTRNVLDLVGEAIKRQDDLREADRRLYNTEIACIKEMAGLRESHQAKMDAAESSRIDSIRGVDVEATARTAMQANTAIQALAASTAASAENLRAVVANTATTLATQLAARDAELNKRLAGLEQAQFEGVGRQRIEDPASQRTAALVEKMAEAMAEGAGRSRVAEPLQAEIIQELKALRASRDSADGKSAGVSMAWVVLLGGVSLVATVLGIFATMKP